MQPTFNDVFTQFLALRSDWQQVPLVQGGLQTQIYTPSEQALGAIYEHFPVSELQFQQTPQLRILWLDREKGQEFLKLQPPRTGLCWVSKHSYAQQLSQSEWLVVSPYEPLDVFLEVFAKILGSSACSK